MSRSSKIISVLERFFLSLLGGILLAVSFDFIPTSILIYAMMSVAAFYLFASTWIFGKDVGSNKIVSVLVGIGLGAALFGWMPVIYNWPIAIPIYQVGLCILSAAVILEFALHGSGSTKKVSIKIFSRIIMIVGITSFLVYGSRYLVYDLVVKKNFEIKLFSIVGKMLRAGKTNHAKLIMERNLFQRSPAIMYRLYGDILLANGDTANAIQQYRQSLRRDTFEHMLSIPLIDIINLRRNGFYTNFQKKKFFPDFRPTKYTPYELEDDWELSVPDSENVSSSVIHEYYSKAEEIPQLVGLLVVKNDKIIAERYYQYSPTHLNATFSSWKSIVSLMVGAAIDRRFIKNVDQTLPEFFPVYPFREKDSRKDIKLKHLLTMTSGIRGRDYDDYWNAKDPVKLILEKPIESAPGTSYKYLTQNMIMVIQAIERTSKIKFDKFCQMVCDSMNILRFYYPDSLIAAESKKIPEMAKPFSWDGTYLTLRDMAKFGLVFLHNGVYKGRRIISESWMKEATRPQYKFTPADLKIEPAIEGFYGYGYFFWLKKINEYNVIAARGWGGQTVVCVPEKNLVVASFGSEWDRTGGKDIENLVFSLTRDLCR